MKKNQLARIKLLNVYMSSKNGFSEENIEELKRILKMLKEARQKNP